MSVEAKVMTKVATLVDFIKTQTKNNLFDASNQGKITVEREDLLVICRVIDDSITSSFVNGSNEVTSVLRGLAETKQTKGRKRKGI